MRAHLPHALHIVDRLVFVSRLHFGANGRRDAQRLAGRMRNQHDRRPCVLRQREVVLCRHRLIQFEFYVIDDADDDAPGALFNRPVEAEAFADQVDTEARAWIRSRYGTSSAASFSERNMVTAYLAGYAAGLGFARKIQAEATP